MIDLNKPVNFAPINKKLRGFFYSDLYCLYAGIILYLILVFSWLPYFQYRINPDGISYILVAQKIVQGDFIQAVNGYWGMGFPVLIALFLKITPIPILAAKYALILSGGIFLIGTSLFINLFLQSTALKRIGLLSASLLIPTFVFEVVTSDLLFAGLFFLYLSYLLAAIQSKKIPLFFTGVLGGLLYLTRENGLYFFISHFLAFVIFFHFFIKKINRGDLNKLVYILCATLIISATFIGTQYLKYETFNIGSRLSYILSWIRPDSPGLVTFTQGFLSLPEASQNIWENTTYHQIVYWNPLSDLRFTFNNLVLNTISFIKVINTFAFILLPLSLISIVWFIYLKDRVVWFLFIVTPFLYSGGFLITYVGHEVRYFWPILLLLYFLICGFLDQLINYNKKHIHLIITMGVLFSISIIYSSFTQTLNLKRAALDSQYVYINSQLQKDGLRSGRIIGSNDHLAESMYISFYSDNKYIGQSTKFIKVEEDMKTEYRSWPELEADFQKFKVDYYLYWGKDENEAKLLSRYPYIKVANSDAKLFQITDY